MDAAAIMRLITQDPTLLGDDLAIWMQKCRWAGLSGMQYPKDYAVSIDLSQDFLLKGQPKAFLLLGITVKMRKPRETRYFCLILTVTKQELGPDGSPSYPISTEFIPYMNQGQWTLRLATLDPIFVGAMLQMKVPSTLIKGPDFYLEYIPSNTNLSCPLLTQGFKVLGGGDTTNSIVRVTIDTQKGLQHLVLKSYLRLFDHNIEAEMMSHLHSVGFSAVPIVEGTLMLKWGDHLYTLVMISQFVENEGDGGKPFWDHLQEYLHITQTQKFVKSELQKIGPLAQLVGHTTHDFHKALYQMTTVVVPQGNVDIRSEAAWEKEFRKKYIKAMGLWIQKQPVLFPSILPETIIKITENLSRIMVEVKSKTLILKSLEPVQQRIHGDLHLGQFLFQPGPPPRFVVTDLEGDPQLPPNRRAEARTVWFDLGSLLRALDYIAFFGAWESLKQQVSSHTWRAEDIFVLFLVRLMDIPFPPTLEQHRWVAESTVAHALEWAEFVGAQILCGYGAKERLWDDLPVAFKLVRATSELNYELGFRGQNALVPLLGVLTMGNRWLQLIKKE